MTGAPPPAFSDDLGRFLVGKKTGSRHVRPAYLHALRPEQTRGFST